ncbi:MAG: EamA family transporter [Candidatus Omnitrophota bacterium]
MNSAGFLAGLISAISWGTVFIFAQIAVNRGAHPVLLSFIRFLVASLVLGLVIILGGTKLRVKKKDWLYFFILGLVGIFGMSTFVFYSLKYTSATSSSILMNANPIFMGLLAFLILREKILFREVLGIILGFIGCWMVVARFGGVPLNLKGNLLAITGALFWAFYSLLGKKFGLIDRYGATVSTFLAISSGTILLFLFLLFSRIPLAQGKDAWLIGTYLGIVPTAVGFSLWFYALKNLKTIFCGALQFLAPLTTGLISVFWLKESISLSLVIGGVLIAAGILSFFPPPNRT